MEMVTLDKANGKRSNPQVYLLELTTAYGPRQDCYGACAKVFADTSICGCGVRRGAEHLSFIAAALAKRTSTTPDQHGEISSDDMATDRSLSNAVRTLGVLFTEIRSTSLP